MRMYMQISMYIMDDKEYNYVYVHFSSENQEEL